MEGKAMKPAKKKPAFEMMKVFNCQDMPEDTKEAFFDVERFNDTRTNDSYVCWPLGELAYGWKDAKTTEEKQHCKNILLVDAWLLEHGAKDGEDVLVRHWW